MTAASLRHVAAAGLGVLLCTGPVLAGEFSLLPNLTLSEEYNDNIYDSEILRRADWVTRVRPGAGVTYRAKAASLDLAYNYDFRTYARGTKQQEQNHRASLQSLVALVDQALYLDLRDSLSRVSLNVTRDRTSESYFLNQSDQNRGVVNPYFLWQATPRSVLKTGYRFADTRYWSGEGIDKREHGGSLELAHTLSDRSRLSASYSFTRVRTSILDFDQHDASLSGFYQYGEGSTVSVAVGNSWQEFSRGRQASHLFWNAAIVHNFGQLVAALQTLVEYAEDPLSISTRQTTHSLKLDKTLAHGQLGARVLYSEYLNTQFDILERRKLAGSITGTYQLPGRLTGTFALGADRVTGPKADDYPYHFTGSGTVSHQFNYGLSAGITYSYVQYRRYLESTRGSKETNRILVEARQSF